VTKDKQTFADLEYAGWQARAAEYDLWLGQITRNGTEDLLDAAGVRAGDKVVDIACGPGYVAGAAAVRGAEALGLDISPAMVAEAKINFPGADFKIGNAEHLDLMDNSVDASICAFGLLHFADADRAIAEVARILKPDGRYAFLVWCSADNHEFFRLVWGAIAKYGDLNADVPKGPDAFRFADPIECERTLKEHGFLDVKTKEIDFSWTTTSIDEILDMVNRSTVRTPMMLDAQTPEARNAIEIGIRERAGRYRTQGGFTTRWAALLVSAKCE